MNTRPTDLAVVALLLVAAGCDSGPVLTSRQVEQVFDAQESVTRQQEALSRGRDDLEADRRQWDERERSDPIVAESIKAAGILIACCLPILVLVCLLSGRQTQAERWPEDQTLLVERFGRPDERRLSESAQDRPRTNLPRP